MTEKPPQARPVPADTDRGQPPDGDTAPSPGAVASDPPPVFEATLAATPEQSRRTADLAAAKGEVIGGYEILGELGRGGMGVVYKARDIRLNRLVALKMTRAGGGADPTDLARFLAEAEAVAAIRHPNVVQVYGYGEYSGHPYMALEYCPGGTLAGHFAARPDPHAAAELVGQIAAGVGAAHAAGIVHRDLKPGNIIFDGDRPKVTDFGVAKRDGGRNLTGAFALIGTPRYMSPEQAGGKSKVVGPPADVWALGVILYECLTGVRPFDGKSTEEVVARVIRAEFDPPRKLRPEIPRDLERVCLKCLAKDPAGRYPRADALADDLRRFAAGEAISIRPQGLLERCYKWVRRERNIVTAWVLTLLSLGLLLSTLWLLNRNRQSPATPTNGRGESPNEKSLRATGQDCGLVGRAVPDAIA